MTGTTHRGCSTDEEADLLTVDLSEFEALARDRGPRCSIGRALEALEAAGVDTGRLRAAMAASHITAPAISRWMGKQGQSVKSYSVQRHRRGDCSCGR